MTYSPPRWLHNDIKLLIVLPKFNALLEGGQQTYTKNATAQGIVFIQSQNGHRTRENLATRVPVDFYQYRAYLTTFHWPLKVDRSLNTINSTFVTLQPNLLSTLGLLRQYNEGDDWLPQDSERIHLKVFNQLLGP